MASYSSVGQDGTRPGEPAYGSLSEIHRGARYAAWRALRLTDGRPVVIKSTIANRPDQATSAARLRGEHELLVALGLPQLATPLELLETIDGPALVLADAGPENLKAWLRHRRVTAETFLTLAIQVTEALALVHERHVIHRALTPFNLVVDGKLRVTLIDFDAATTVPVFAPAEGVPAEHDGALDYAAPEETGRMNRLVDQRADLYSLGATFYELLTGAPPFPALDPMQLVHAHLARAPVPPAERRPDIPAVLSELVLKLLAKMPEQRYQTAEAVLADLREARGRLEPSGAIASFDLGLGDLTHELPLPERIYGRAEELSDLESVFDWLARGERGLVLVTGAAGVGKSTLATQLRDRVVEEGGHFLVAKSDLRASGVPYASLVESFGKLVNQLCDAPPEELAMWRDRLHLELGPNGRVIADLIPDLERLMGPQPKVPAVEPRQSANRFRLVFQAFVRALATAEHPLVVFADDLQWADLSSLTLLRILATSIEMPYFLLVVAFRPEEIGRDDSAGRTLAALQQAGPNTRTVALRALDLDAITALCRDVLRCDDERARPLARALLRKTAGNPFFIKRLLRFVRRSGLLTFDAVQGRWQWDLARIEALTVTENVADLLVATLRGLPEPTQRALEIAVCFGRRFSPTMVAEVSDQPLEAVVAALSVAIAEGLLVPLEPSECPIEAGEPGPWYQFAHDRVQQAVDSLLDEESKKRVHHRIGNRLARGVAAEQLGERIFEVVAHLNYARDLISDEGERERLVALNAAAARRARASSAYGPALGLLQQAIELLPEAAWQSRRDLVAALHHDAIECAYLSGDSRLGEQLFERALANAEEPLEQAALFNLRVVASTLAGDLTGAIRWGARGLALVGITLPPAEELERAARAENAAVEANLDGRTVEELVEGPAVSAPEQAMAMRILSNLFAPTYMGHQGLYAFIVACAVNLTLRHGYGVHSPFAYAGYAVILPSFTNDYARAHAFGRVAVGLSRRLHDPAEQCRVFGMFGAFVNSWRASLRSSIPILRESVARGLESGEIQYASYWGLSISKHLLHQGVELSRLLTEVENAIAIGRRTNMRAGYEWQRPFRQLVRCLRGQTRGFNRLDDDDFDEQAYRESIAGEPYALSLYEGIRLQLHYLARDFAAARALSELSEARTVFQRGTPAPVDHNFYTSLTRAAMADGSGDDRAAAIAAIEANQRQLDVWATNCPENYRHKHLLVAAELLRLRRQHSEAAALYDQAIEAAGRERFLQDQALANELAGRFYLAQGRRHIASLYLSSALSVYARWGATAKLDALEREFPSLLGPLWGATRDGQGVATIDLLAILKAAEAISTEVVLDRLLETLLDVCMASAGAERGALLLCEGEQLFVRAWGSVAQAATLDRTPAATSPRVPTGIIEHVLKSGEPLALDDAMRDPGFAGDAYVADHAVRSVLALPIRKQARLVGLLYLENSLVSGVFTAERLRVLRLLSSQIAISLENGLLFERVTAEVRERTRAEQAMRFLADAGVALAESLEVQTILDRLVQLMVPRLADWCVVDLIEAGDRRLAAGTHVDARRAPLVAQLIERHPLRRGARHLGSRALDSGKARLVPAIGGAMLRELAENEDHEELLRQLGLSSAIELPLVVRGATIGAITLGSARGYEASDLALAEELARRVALAIENAQLYRETQEAVRARDEFLSVASHELNTPMTSLRLSLQNLLAQAADAPLDARLVVKTAALAERQGRRLTLLIRDLLDVTRLDRGTPRLELREHDLVLLVRGVLASFAPELERVGCEVRLSAPPSLPGRWDGMRIEQVVLNLLANAAKFGAGAPIDVEVAAVGERVRLVVRDHGIGIDPARQAHIFDRFERAVSATHYGGLGLGLYICRRLVEAHGGTIAVTSAAGAGATFVVELPVLSLP